jgi:hypothetical protein
MIGARLARPVRPAEGRMELRCEDVKELHSSGRAGGRIAGGSTRHQLWIKGGSSAKRPIISGQACAETLTSIPACRKSLRAEKNNRYFDFKLLKICAHLNISYNFL